MFKNALIIIKKSDTYKEIQIANHVFDLVPFPRYIFYIKRYTLQTDNVIGRCPGPLAKFLMGLQFF